MFFVPMHRLAASKGQKADNDVGIRNLVEQLVTDVLLVHCQPGWPAALPLLLRLINALHSKAGIFSPDNAVRQVSVDLLGLIAAQLCHESQCAKLDADTVKHILQNAGRCMMPPNFLQI
jgi:hypothetical protein